MVWQHVTSQLVLFVIMWFTVKWRPRLLFSMTRLKGLFSYGWKILATRLLIMFELNLRGLIIGKLFSAEVLGYFGRGTQFPSLIVSNIDGSIQSVMLPAYSSQQKDRKRVKDMVRRAVVTSSFLVFPLMIGLAVVAKPLVQIVLTDRWLPCVPFLQIYCITHAIMPIYTANLEAIKALGFSGTLLRLEFIKKTLGLAVLFITVFLGVYAIAWGVAICGLIGTFINSYPNKKVLGYGFKEQLGDVLPSLLLSAIMGVSVYCLTFIGLTAWATLTLQICLGGILYVAMAKVLRLECYAYLQGTMSELSKRAGGGELRQLRAAQV